MTETIDGQLVVGFTPIVLRGDTGPKGDKGESGAAGAVPSLTVGTVANGASASASITGSTSNPVLNLTLPVADLSAYQAQLGTLVPFGSTPPDHTVVPVYVDITTVPPTLKGWDGTAWVPIGGGTSSGFTITDQGNGLASITPTGSATFADLGNGLAALTGGSITDNGNGTAVAA